MASSNQTKQKKKKKIVLEVVPLSVSWVCDITTPTPLRLVVILQTWCLRYLQMTQLNPLTHLQFHHRVLTHFVPSGLRYIIDTNELGLIPHAVSFKPGKQVLICLLWAGYTWRNRNKS